MSILSNKMKRLVFTLIALIIPVAFFVLLELTLRGMGYGFNTPLFIENPSAPQYLLPKPDVVKRYFSDPKVAPNVTIETNFFLKNKPADSLRIFVQGGSTAAGFPYGFGASIAGMLDYRLKQTFPDKHVEVINTALSAVNSYTILDFVDEIIEQKPDAVLIYAGHNEYLGILGVGSAYTAANSRAATLMYLKLKELRTFQLVQDIYSWFQAAPENKSNARTVMAKVAKHKNIPTDSDLFQQGINQFEQNMLLVLAKYQRAGIPVFLSTIASNLSDQVPFSSVPIPKDLSTMLSEAQSSALDLSKVQLLEQAFEDSSSAHGHFELGKLFSENGFNSQAKKAFENARQHDLLRFRAPNEINDVIRSLAQSSNVHFVDSEQALESVANEGIVGNDLMLEHLHPNVKGFFEIADSFYNAIEQTRVIGSFPNRISRFNAAVELPIFDAEIYWGEAKVAGLMADYPFKDSPQEPVFKPQNSWSDRLGFAAYKKKVDWVTIARETLKRSEGKDVKTFLKAAKLLSDALPYNKEFSYRAGMLLVNHKRWLEAPRYLKRTLDIDDKNLNAMLALAHSYAQQNRYDLTKKWLENVLIISPKNQTALTVLKQLPVE